MGIADEAARAAAVQSLIDELGTDLVEARLPPATADTAAMIYARALFEADALGLLPFDDAAKLDAMTAPVRLRGPSSSAAAIAYLAAYLVADTAPANAMAWLDDCASRFPDEDFAALRRADLLASLRHRLGRTAQALDLIDRTIERAERPGGSASEPQEEMLAHLHGTRAEIRFDLGLFDVADADLDAAERHARAIGSVGARFDALTIRLDQYLGLGRFQHVLRCSEDRDEFGAERAHQIAVYRAAALRFLEHDRPGSRAEAVDLLEAAIGSGSLPPDLWESALQKLIALALDRGDGDGARGLWERLDRAFPVDPSEFEDGSADVIAFDTVSLGTRVVLENTGLAPVETDVLATRLPLHRAAFRALLRRWDATELRAGGWGRLHLDRWRRVVGEYLRLQMAIEPGEAGLRSALDSLFEVQARASLSRAIGAPTASLDLVRERLGPLHGVLILLPIDHATLVFAFDRTRIGGFDSLGADELQLAVLELTRLLQQGREQDERFELVARSVADTLLPDELAAWVSEWRQMTVVGADLLGGLPIEVLALPAARDAADDRPLVLGERLAIDHVASMGAWVELGERRVRSGATWFFASLQPGPAVGEVAARLVPRRLVDPLIEMWGGTSATLRIDREFTVGALLGADLRDAACLHLLAHGTWDDGREIGALLAASPDQYWPDGLVTADRIAAMASIPPVVFLSACRAGTSHPRSGDGHIGTLAGTLLERGARAVVIGAGDLELEPHIALVIAFHQALAEGESPAEAMRKARLATVGAERSPRRLREITLQVVGNGQIDRAR